MIEMTVTKLRKYKLSINPQSFVQQISKHVLKNINDFNSKKHLSHLMSQLRVYRMGDRTLHEILALEFSKNVNHYDWTQKAYILH